MVEKINEQRTENPKIGILLGNSRLYLWEHFAEGNNSSS